MPKGPGSGNSKQLVRSILAQLINSFDGYISWLYNAIKCCKYLWPTQKTVTKWENRPINDFPGADWYSDHLMVSHHLRIAKNAVRAILTMPTINQQLWPWVDIWRTGATGTNWDILDGSLRVTIAPTQGESMDTTARILSVGMHVLHMMYVMSVVYAMCLTHSMLYQVISRWIRVYLCVCMAVYVCISHMCAYMDVSISMSVYVCM